MCDPLRQVLRPVLRGPFDAASAGPGGEIRYLLNTKYAAAPASWYDTQDMSSMFQDLAMTVPAALEQPVAIQLDKSGRGWHRSQATASKRPKLSRRENYCTNTEAPGTWGFVGTRCSVGTISPDGSAEFTATVEDATLLAAVTTEYPAGAASRQDTTVIRSIEFKAGTATYFRLGGAAGEIGAVVNTTTGAVVYGGAPGTVITVTALSGGWYRLEIFSSAATFGSSQLSNYASWGNVNSGVYGIGPAGQIGSTVFLRRPSYALRGLGWTQSIPYQRVTSASDYDADPAKFPAYLALDGVDDAMVTATQTGWSTTSAVSVFAALQRFDNAAAGVVAELGANSSAGNGFSLMAPPTAAANTLQMLANGGTVASATAATAAAYKGILSGRANIATPKVQAWLGNTAGDLNSASQGAGPYANNPVNWFARNQASAYFKGRAFGEIVIGADLPDDEMALIRKYLAMKSGSTL